MAPPPPTDLPSLTIPDFPGLNTLMAETPASYADVPTTLRLIVEQLAANAVLIATATVPPAGVKETPHTRMFMHIAAGVKVAIEQLVTPSLTSLADAIENKVAEAELMNGPARIGEAIDLTAGRSVVDL